MNDVSVLLVSYAPTHEPDNALLLVWVKKKGELPDIINAFQGREATELYSKLITVKK